MTGFHLSFTCLSFAHNRLSRAIYCYNISGLSLGNANFIWHLLPFIAIGHCTDLVLTQLHVTVIAENLTIVVILLGALVNLDYNVVSQ